LADLGGVSGVTPWGLFHVTVYDQEKSEIWETGARNNYEINEKKNRKIKI